MTVSHDRGGGGGVVPLPGGEGQHGAQGAHQGRVDDHLLPPRLQRRSLQRRDRVSHMEVDHVFQLVGRPVEQPRRACEFAAGRVVLHLQ